MATFELAESDARWNELSTHLDKWNVVDVVRTTFTKRELAAANWLRIGPDWHHGYPQPADDFGYLEKSYDLTDYCRDCGIGKKQVAPIRFKGEPKWGKRQILQVNWIFDEYFVPPELWDAVFRPLGIPCRPVVADRSEAELKTIVQLQIDALATAELSIQDQPVESCSACGRSKYLPFVRGMLPTPKVPEGVNAFKTLDWFGSGASANREIIISATVYDSLIAHSAKGARFEPLGEEMGTQLISEPVSMTALTTR